MLLWGTSAGVLAALAVLTPDWRIPAAVAVAVGLLMLCFWALIEPQRWWIGFVVTVLLLPPFPLAIGNAGPHIGLVFVALGVWCSVAHFRRWRIETDGVTLALASFWCWLLVTTCVAMLYSGVLVALGGMARVGLFGIGVFSYFYIAHGPGRLSNVDVFRWSRWVFCLAAISAAWASIEFYFQWPAFGRFAEQFVWLPFGVFRRAQGVFREAGMLGNVCAMFLVMAAVASARVEVRRRIAPTFWLLMGSSALLCGLVLSFSRSSLVNLAAAGTALLLLERRRIQFVRLLGFIAAVRPVAWSCPATRFRGHSDSAECLFFRPQTSRSVAALRLGVARGGTASRLSSQPFSAAGTLHERPPHIARRCARGAAQRAVTRISLPQSIVGTARDPARNELVAVR